MSTTALTSARTQSLAVRHPQPLLSVMVWELRRIRASRLFWVQALGFFCFLLLVIWFGRTPSTFFFGDPHLMFNGFVAGTSAWGLLKILPAVLLLLVILLPFINADGVTRDLNRRTHELLMTTALPSWAYVWGRYLMGLLMSLVLALLMLAAIVGTGLLLHLTITAYPAPQIDNVMTLWIGMVVPATILVSSASFALGTLLPRQANLVRIVILLVWFLGAEIPQYAVFIPNEGKIIPPTWYVNWDPTSAATAFGMLSQYEPVFNNLSATATSAAQLQLILLAIENKAPDIAGWFVPHLLLAGLSLLLVALAAFSFQRFRNAFGA